MRKGFTLVEIIVVIAVLPLVMFVLDGLFSTLLTNIPRSHRVVQENTILLSMIDQMQDDIDNAKGLPASFNEYSASDELILIELEGSVICYQLQDGKVIRKKLTDNDKDESEETTWSVPYGIIGWKVWRKNGNGYAVEVKTHIEYEIKGHLKKKLANSHLFFVNAF